jgi:hypothetical protein
MTEDEARKKWCPMVRQASPEDWNSCIASDCMMWRWKPEPPPFSVPYYNQDTELIETFEVCEVGADEGYCGLAGSDL